MEHRILLIDDSEDDALILKRQLALAGWEEPLLHVNGAKQAVDYLDGKGEHADRRRFPLPDVVFLDLRLPGDMDGFELLKWIKSQPHLGRLIVIVITNIEDPKQIQRAYDLGAHSYLSKGANIDEVWNMVRFLTGYFRIAKNLPLPEAARTAN